ncbi:MAG: hypothetical protein O9340_03290 [Cyclobacteriaceae bacterium]|jgi:hypothetical protein|nr:hypothetical protein [Cyclobacteriaceae bacterium]
MILDKDKEIDKGKDFAHEKQVEEQAFEGNEKPKKNDEQEEENPYGGLPNRNLKKNLGCG